MLVMSSMEPGRGRRMTRKQREHRAYQLTLATGGFGVATVVTFVLALTPILGAGLPILLAILTVVSLVLLRRTLGQ